MRRGYPDAGSALLQIARETDDTDTRWLAIRGLGALKVKDAVPFLRQCLRSKSEYVRANAARALGEIHDEVAIPDLVRTLTNEDDGGVIEQTALALQMLGARDAAPALKVKAANASGHTSGQTRVWILGAIESLGSKNDAPFFAQFIFDKDNFVEWYAARALERLTGQDFGFPNCGPAPQADHSQPTGGYPCSAGEGVNNARRWWNDHKTELTLEKHP